MRLRSFLLSLLSTLAMSACLLAPSLGEELTLPTPSSFRSIVIWNEKTGDGGSACPVGVGAIAYTAKHVTDDLPDVWYDPVTKRHGHVRVSATDKVRDFAIVQPAEDGELFPHPSEIAKHAPETGEALLWDGLVDGRFAVRLHGWAMVLNAMNDGELWVDGEAIPGLSGGCVASSLPNGPIYAILLGNVYSTEPHPTWRPRMRAEPIWGRR